MRLLSTPAAQLPLVKVEAASIAPTAVTAADRLTCQWPAIPLSGKAGEAVWMVFLARQSSGSFLCCVLLRQHFISPTISMKRITIARYIHLRFIRRDKLYSDNQSRLTGAPAGSVSLQYMQISATCEFNALHSRQHFIISPSSPRASWRAWLSFAQ